MGTQNVNEGLINIYASQLNGEQTRDTKRENQGGGYILASVHTIMNDVPAENILAMAQAVEDGSNRGG